MRTIKRKIFLILAGGFLGTIIIVLSGCASTVPQNPTNICAVFQQNPSWYTAAARSQRRWGVPMSTLMAIMYQESRFQPTVKPPRERLFSMIPWVRPTSADGFSQATYETWWQYQDDTDNFAAQRSNFKDAIDFVGWYSRKAHQKLGIPLNNTFELYLAYHEGLQGYASRSYARQPWLIEVSHRVQAQANTYHYQLVQCGAQFSSHSWL